MSETTPLSQKFYRWAVPNGWGPVDVGWLVTVLWLFFVEWLAFLPSSEPNRFSTKLDEFINAPTSQIGDTLAGIFAVLALVWIIVTVFLQSHELREQRKEFHDMANAMSAQAAIFQDEQKQRLENRTEELFQQKLKRLLHIIHNQKKRTERHDDFFANFFAFIDTSGDEALLLHSLKDVVADKLVTFDATHEQQLEPLDSEFIDVLVAIKSALDDTIPLLCELSEAQRQRHSNLEIGRTSDLISRILNKHRSIEMDQESG